MLSPLLTQILNGYCSKHKLLSTLGRATSRSAQTVTSLHVVIRLFKNYRRKFSREVADGIYLQWWVVRLIVSCRHTSRRRFIQSGDTEEGPTWCTPIKIQAPQGQVTLCSENFPGSSLLRLRPLPLCIPFRDDVIKRREDEQISDASTSCCVYCSRTYRRTAISEFELCGVRQCVLQLHVREDYRCS